MTYGTVFPSSKVNGTVVFHPTLILHALRLGVRLFRSVMCCCMFRVSVILDRGLSLVQSVLQGAQWTSQRKDLQLLHLHTCTGTRQHSASGSQVLEPGVALTLPDVSLPRSALCSHVAWQGKTLSYAFQSFLLFRDIANGNGQFSGSGSLLPGLWVALI
jgi:hypothetical protein